MARSDLLLALVKASSAGDRRAMRATVEAMIAEERAKQHHALADRLLRALVPNGNGSLSTAVVAESSSSSKEFLAEILPRRKLEDISLKREIRSCIEEIIEEQRRADLLRAHGLEPRNCILLVGPPGNGKTTLAEAVAEALGISFFVVRYDRIIGSYLGETASRLRRIFDYVRTTPCVLFFDEFDAIGKERGDVHETGEIKRVVTSLLMQMDDLPSYTVVIAATNHPELLDRASWRRFHLRLELPQPDEEMLSDYLKFFEDEFGKRLGVSASALAKKLGNVSYAEAEQFCLNVKRRMVLAHGEKSIKQIFAEQLKAWRELKQI